MFASWSPAQPEITDLIIQHDPHTLQRLPVRKADLVALFSKFRNRQALRVIRALPENDGVLDSRAIDRLLLTVHWEMQRLSEEFYHGRRVWELLCCVIASIRQAGVRERLRITDIGCGTGYTTRWLATKVPLGEYNIELVGMDLNSTLIAEASRLAFAESLPCQFIHGDAFSAEHSGNIFLSTGVIHHFRGDSLLAFLRRHEQAKTQAFLHFDFRPSLLAPFGSMFFHYLGMRTAIAHHDGVLSAARAHPGRTLTEAARTAAPAFVSDIYGTRIWKTPVPRVFHTLVGLRPALVPQFRQQLGRRVSRLGDLA